MKQVSLIVHPLQLVLYTYGYVVRRLVIIIIIIIIIIMDIKQLQINDSSYIEGTICLVNE